MQRAESNAAIKAHDAVRLRKLFDDDYHGIQGAPTSIVNARSGKRVAEAGHWEGIGRKPDGIMRKTGVYLAMWIPSGGTWRLKSEAFVTLECTGSATCDKAG
jgi:hypothetical protein